MTATPEEQAASRARAQRQWRAKNRDKWNAYMREYNKKQKVVRWKRKQEEKNSLSVNRHLLEG